MFYSPYKKGGEPNASVLYEMQGQERNEGCQEHNHEEWQAGDSGCVSRVRNQDVQDREELRQILQVSCLLGRLGISEKMSSLLFAHHTEWTIV